MADQEPSGQMANMHLDESTGEMVRCVGVLSMTVQHSPCNNSKSELKKRQKQRDNEEKKKAKAAAAPPKPEKKATSSSAEDQETDLTPNVRSTTQQYVFQQSQD